MTLSITTFTTQTKNQTNLDYKKHYELHTHIQNLFGQ